MSIIGLKIRSICDEYDRTELPPVNGYNLHVNQFLISLCIVTIIALIYINFRVIQIVGASDLSLVLMLIFLKLSLLAYAIFFSFNASLNQYFVCFGRYYYCMTGLFVSWPGVLLGQAMLCNLNKWIYFIIYVRHVKYETEPVQFIANLKRSKIYLNLATLICSITIFATECTYSAKACGGYYTSES